MKEVKESVRTILQKRVLWILLLSFFGVWQSESRGEISRCVSNLTRISDIQFKNRVHALKESIKEILTVSYADKEEEAYAQQQLRGLYSELKQLEQEGVLYEENLLFDIDSYKASQFLQYHPKMTKIFSYLESRGGKYDKTVFFGLQYILKKYFSKPITAAMVEQAKIFYEAHGEPFNYDGWMYIAQDLGGRIPIKIRAVKEGSVVPTRNILMSIESTDPKALWAVEWFQRQLTKISSHWVPGWNETQFMRLWFPTTVATLSYHIYETIYDSLLKTSDHPDESILFKLHDFGSRGVSSQESAGIGGMAHLLNFRGSDTVTACRLAKVYYHEPMAGKSVPASEHSTQTSWPGGREGEAAAMENLLDQFGKPGAIFGSVLDSYDDLNAIDNIWGTKLKDKLIESGATLAGRPDSGNPPDVVLESLQHFEQKFGAIVNKKGYKVLNYVFVLQGDGINHESIKEILRVANDAGYSTDSISFGMGGALLQGPNRDTQQFAFKASWGIVDGKEIEIFKDPIREKGKKSSKKGLLDLVLRDGEYQTIAGVDHPDSQMQVVWEFGRLFVDDTFAEVRERVSEARVRYRKKAAEKAAAAVH